MPKLDVSGVNIHYETAGSGEPLVLIHGLMGALSDLQPKIVPQLTDRFTVLTFDLRGHGESDMPSSGYTSADIAGDVIALLNAEKIERAHIVGHSFGGAVALSVVTAYPDRVIRLTVSDSVVRAFQPVLKVKGWIGWPLWRGLLQKLDIEIDEDSEFDLQLFDTLRQRRKTPPQPDPRWEQWNKLLASTTARADFSALAGLTAEVISGIRLPTQAIYGELSVCMPSLEGLRAHLPGLEFVVLPGMGHRFPMTEPTTFVKHIKAFHARDTEQPAEAKEP